MSLGDWTAWNARRDRPREQVRDELPPIAAVPLLAEPMEVEEESLTDTAVTRIRSWIVGRDR